MSFVKESLKRLNDSSVTTSSFIKVAFDPDTLAVKKVSVSGDVGGVTASKSPTSANIQGALHVGGYLSDLEERRRKKKRKFKKSYNAFPEWFVKNECHEPAGSSAGGQFCSADGGKTKTITNLQGDKVPAPRTFYRGDNPGDERRISTGNNEWDKHLFVADNEDAASTYGKQITQIDAKPEARILYEGTKEFNQLAHRMKGGNLLDYSTAVVNRAKGSYDAVWFKRQGDVGTVILNRNAFNIPPHITKAANWWQELIHAEGNAD